MDSATGHESVKEITTNNSDTLSLVSHDNESVTMHCSDSQVLLNEIVTAIMCGFMYSGHYTESMNPQMIAVTVPSRRTLLSLQCIVTDTFIK